MKKCATILASLATLFAFCTGASAQPNAQYHARLALDLVQPTDDVWDHGIGGSAAFRSIGENNLGFAFSIAVQRWDIDGGDTGPWLSLPGLEARELASQNQRVAAHNEAAIPIEGAPDETGTPTMTTSRAVPFSGVTISNPDVDGHATVVPLGVSGLIQLLSSGPVSVVVEGGIRYLIIESGVEWSADFATQGGTGDFGESGRRRGTAKIENAIVGFAGVDVIIDLSREISLFGGLSVQVDIEKAGVESPGATSVGDIEMAAVAGHAGVLIRY